MSKAPGSRPLNHPTRVDTLDPEGYRLPAPEPQLVPDGGTVEHPNKEPGTQ